MSEQITKKRYASLAVFMNLISPGMGHLYVGKWKLAITFPLLLILLLALMGWSRLIFLSEGMIIVMAITALFYLFVMVSSFIAARNPASHNLNKSQRWYFYILFVVVVAVLNSLIMDYRGKIFGFEPFRIPAASMLPTMLYNDFLVVDTWAYRTKEPDVGDVVVFDYPRDPEIKYVKRLMGKGGDHLAYNNKVLYVNGKSLKREFIGRYNTAGSPEEMEEYKEYIGNYEYGITLIPSRPAMDAEFIVPEGYYFVMGDNRDNSNDSRYWGVVPRDYLYGKAAYVWFSFDAEFNIRSERMGVRL